MDIVKRHNKLVYIQIHISIHKKEYDGMDGKRLEEIMQSHGVINVTYNGLSVWVEGMRGDMAEVTFIGADRRLDVPIGELSEDERDGGSFQSPLENDLI